VLVNIGVSYKKAPLATLDALTLRELPAFYKILKGVPGVRGAVVVQTCNRVDMFIDADEDIEVSEKVLWNWALETKFKLHELMKLAEQRTGEQVIEYLVSLASGLESMLVGESQILVQLKSSLIEARGLAASSPALSKIFEMSLAAGTSIRDKSVIGKGRPRRHQDPLARNRPDRHDSDENIQGQGNQRCDCCKQDTSKNRVFL